MNFDTRTTWQLANMAGCSGPDRPDHYGFEPRTTVPFPPSPGAEFLRRIARDIEEGIDYNPGARTPEDLEDLVHETADNAVPVYTHQKWATFVDLAAYNEDPTELGFDGSDMGKGADVCLYLIASRLAGALIELHFEGLEDDDDEEVTA